MLIMAAGDLGLKTDILHSYDTFPNFKNFLHHGLAGGELCKDVVGILVVVDRCGRDGRVKLPADAEVVHLGRLVPLLLLRHHGELVAQHLPSKDLERGRDQPGKIELRFIVISLEKIAFQSHLKLHFF